MRPKRTYRPGGQNFDQLHNSGYTSPYRQGSGANHWITDVSTTYRAVTVIVSAARRLKIQSSNAHHPAANMSEISQQSSGRSPAFHRRTMSFSTKDPVHRQQYYKVDSPTVPTTSHNFRLHSTPNIGVSWPRIPCCK